MHRHRTPQGLAPRVECQMTLKIRRQIALQLTVTEPK
jgi:hypothetical protein